MNLDVVFDSFPRLETERLVLRPLHADDAPALYAVLSNPQVTEFYDDDAFTDISQASEQLTAWSRGYEARRSIRWGITLRGDDTVIGTCGYYGFHAWYERAAIGYELAQAYWRQGIMTEALGAMLEFGFAQVGLNRVEAVVMPGNVGSLRLLEGLGFVREGVLRDYERWGSKGLVDLVMYALLRRDHVTRITW